MKRKGKSWDEYERELFQKGKLSEEEILIEKMKMDFSKLIYDCRIRRNLTQKELADKIQVKQQYIAKIESGEENLSLETIGKLLVALKSGLRVGIQTPRRLTQIFKYAA